MNSDNRRTPLQQMAEKEDSWIQARPVSEKAAELFKKSKRAMLFYYIFTVGMGVFVIFLMIAELFWRKSSDTHAFSLLFCYLFFSIGMIFGRTAGEYRRMLCAWKASPRVLRDYCFLQYGKSRRNVSKYTMLFLMAKCDIYSGDPKAAGEELNRVNYYGIPAVHQAAYHLLWALIDRFSGRQEEYERNVEVYRRMVLAQGGRLPRGEERLQILLRGNGAELRGLTDLQEDLRMSKEKAFWSSLLGFSLFFLMLLVVGKELLPAGLDFRNWFLILGCGGFQILAFVSGLMTLVKGHLMQKKLGSSGTGRRVLGVVGLIVMIFLFLLNDFHGMLSLNKEKMLQNGGSQGLEDWGGEEDTGEGGAQEETVTASEDEKKRQAYQAIYDSGLLKASGELTFCYSAKGELYALVGEPYDSDYMGDATKAQCRLVYDRLSKNGRCYEIVCYEDHQRPGEDQVYTTTISDIYAVVISTGEVISGGRTGWAEEGNDEYRQATGE